MKQAQYRAKRKAAEASTKREPECSQDFYMQSYVENSVFQSCCFSHGDRGVGRGGVWGGGTPPIYHGLGKCWSFHVKDLANVGLTKVQVIQMFMISNFNLE